MAIHEAQTLRAAIRDYAVTWAMAQERDDDANRHNHDVATERMHAAFERATGVPWEAASGDGFWEGPGAHEPQPPTSAASVLFNVATILELAEDAPATVRCYRRVARALAERRAPDDEEYDGCGPRLKHVIRTMTDPENQPHQWKLRG